MLPSSIKIKKIPNFGLNLKETKEKKSIPKFDNIFFDNFFEGVDLVRDNKKVLNDGAASFSIIGSKNSFPLKTSYLNINSILIITPNENILTTFSTTKSTNTAQPVSTLRYLTMAFDAYLKSNISQLPNSTVQKSPIVTAIGYNSGTKNLYLSSNYPEKMNLIKNFKNFIKLVNSGQLEAYFNRKLVLLKSERNSIKNSHKIQIRNVDKLRIEFNIIRSEHHEKNNILIELNQQEQFLVENEEKVTSKLKKLKTQHFLKRLNNNDITRRSIFNLEKQITMLEKQIRIIRIKYHNVNSQFKIIKQQRLDLDKKLILTNNMIERELIIIEKSKQREMDISAGVTSIKIVMDSLSILSEKMNQSHVVKKENSVTARVIRLNDNKKIFSDREESFDSRTIKSLAKCNSDLITALKTNLLNIVSSDRFDPEEEIKVCHAEMNVTKNMIQDIEPSEATSLLFLATSHPFCADCFRGIHFGVDIGLRDTLKNVALFTDATTNFNRYPNVHNIVGTVESDTYRPNPGRMRHQLSPKHVSFKIKKV